MSRFWERAVGAWESGQKGSFLTRRGLYLGARYWAPGPADEDIRPPKITAALGAWTGG
ncbi:MAG: hypothetical protein HZB26_24795 [Candidatus Hydrogenedentes bacterium]|nr:hypothetical protein [Candidatus Hydrogenedentota bacterium]